MGRFAATANRRLGAMALDQAVAGASNFGIAILAARVLGPVAFGLFGIVFLLYVTSIGTTRALVNDPLLVNGAEAQERPGEVLGACWLLGLTAATVIGAAAVGCWMWRPDLAGALGVLALCTPLLAIQDTGRYLGFATQRPGSALVLDSIWFAAVLVGGVALVRLDVHSLAAFLAVWAGSGVLSGLPVLWWYRDGGPRPGTRWLRETWSSAWRYLMSFGATQGAALAASFVLVAFAGPAALGAVRGALLLVRPYSTFQIAVMASGVAEIARTDVDDVRGERRHVTRTTTVASVVAVVNGSLLLLLPDWAGRALLGQTWAVVVPLLMPVAVSLIGLGLLTGARTGTLGRRRISTVLRVDVTAIVLVLALSITGAVTWGAVGYYWGVAAGQVTVMTIWWWVYLRARRVPVRGRHRR